MDIAKLARMANQIAANFAAQGHDVAVAETALHIWKFWDPRMKAGIYGSDLSQLSPIARAAIGKLMADAEAV
jgi:formate dehydrogenase subunit delta